MTTYNDLYLSVHRRLKNEGFPGASLEARELVCYGSGKTKEEFFRDAPLYAPAETEAAVNALADRHIAGEPVAYLIGEWEFYGLTLDVNESVLIPRVDTEVLAGEAIGYLRSQGRCRVLDLCAGSGCVGLAAASQAPECRVLLGEISEPAARICRQNIRRCGLTGRVSVMTLDALQPPPKSLGEFQCIVCNPPYIPRADIDALERSVKDFEPYLALCGGEDGFDFYSAIIQQWKTVLTCRGRLYFEVGIGQADTVLRMMRAEGFGDINVVPDGQNIPRVVYGTLLESI
ncbi:MAG: peptide chain release factor N(5)-glutamine methyltransferase [Oscillospiraceae bacterium]|jgi:release factor glutamine methyltransferase|nr:peptide chain release factor N(5)-glutamine methyltransferase [Oscillospiraceae bacterium]